MSLDDYAKLSNKRDFLMDAISLVNQDKGPESKPSSIQLSS